MKILVIRPFLHQELTGLLTSAGNEQGIRISVILRNLLDEGEQPSLSVASYAPTICCRRSAYILGVDLIMPVVRADCLDWSPNGNDARIKEMIAYYGKRDAIMLVLIPHDEMASRICEWAISERGGQIAERVDLAPGQCCLVREDGTHILIP